MASEIATLEHSGSVSGCEERGNGLTGLEKAVTAVLDYKPLSLTSIYESLDAESRIRYPIAQISVTLINLCMKNLAKQAGAGYYMRS